MLQMLSRFAALSLVSGLVMSLLPEGSLRRTAAMVVGLMMLIFWAEGISGAIGALSALPDDAGPLPLLTSTGVDLADAQASAAAALTPDAEDVP